jgi:cytidylate kinase
MRPRTIAIDGPAGSGKSTIGFALGQRLGYTMLDTGLIYRLVAYEVLRAGETDATGDSDDGEAILTAAKAVLSQVDVHIEGNESKLMLGESSLVDLPLHTERVSTFVPHVGKVSGVRELVRAIQRKVVASGHSIIAGRDIGTVVVPEAELKLYLDVSLEERAARRMWATGGNADRLAIQEALSVRDRLDMARTNSPLKVADDAVVIRTDKMAVDDTVTSIVEMCGLEVVA